MTEPCDLSAVEARTLIGRRALSPVELMASCIARIEATDHAINAMDSSAGTPIVTAAMPIGGTSASVLSAWAHNPPILLQPATQPVARPRTFTG